MEIKGKFLKSMPVQDGQSAKGTWRKQMFAVTTEGQYPKTVAFTVWNDMIDQIAPLQPGASVTVRFDAESREYNDKFYTDLKAFAVIAEAGANTSAPLQTIAEKQFAEAAGDDLPF